MEENSNAADAPVRSPSRMQRPVLPFRNGSDSVNHIRSRMIFTTAPCQPHSQWWNRGHVLRLRQFFKDGKENNSNGKSRSYPDNPFPSGNNFRVNGLGGNIRFFPKYPKQQAHYCAESLRAQNRLFPATFAAFGISYCQGSMREGH